MDRAFVITVLVAVVIWIVVRVMLALQTSSATRYEMDFGLGKGSFFSVFTVYRRLAYFTIIAGLLIAGGISYVRALSPSTVFFEGSVVYAYLFIAYTTYCYESYMHAKYPLSGDRDGVTGFSNYTANAYATVIALGWSSVFLFVLGIISASSEIR